MAQLFKMKKLQLDLKSRCTLFVQLQLLLSVIFIASNQVEVISSSSVCLHRDGKCRLCEKSVSLLWNVNLCLWLYFKESSSSIQISSSFSFHWVAFREFTIHQIQFVDTLSLKLSGRIHINTNKTHHNCSCLRKQQQSWQSTEKEKYEKGTKLIHKWMQIESDRLASANW